MTREQLEAIGFIVVDGSVEEISYKDYLDEYGRDETTTPNGIGDRLHIREEVVDHTEEGDDIKEWQIWTWGVRGNHPSHCGPDFNNEEDAELYYYERSEWYVQEKNWDAPAFYGTESEAENDIIEVMAEKDSIDKTVAASIFSKRKRVNAKRSVLIKQHLEKFDKEYIERKEYLAIAVPAEADSITIDKIFIDDVKELKHKSGVDKSNYAASIMKGLLSRNNMGRIQSDFWQVFRLLKSKAEHTE